MASDLTLSLPIKSSTIVLDSSPAEPIKNPCPKALSRSPPVATALNPDKPPLMIPAVSAGATAAETPDAARFAATFAVIEFTPMALRFCAIAPDPTPMSASRAASYAISP